MLCVFMAPRPGMRWVMPSYGATSALNCTSDRLLARGFVHLKRTMLTMLSETEYTK
jgi:hypothetical protein